MRLLILLLTAGIMQVSAATYAQNITIQARNETLEKFLKTVKQQSGYDFVCDQQILKEATRVNVSLKDATVEQALSAALDQQHLSFTISDKLIVIEKKATAAPQKIKEAAAPIDVIGRVFDESGQPLIGATVSVKGGNNAVLTDADGTFRLKAVQPDATLVISFIGFEKQEVRASTYIPQIKLKVTESKLDEVQVIAYGQQSQRLSVGDVTTISAKEIEKQPVSNPLLALEGRVPGLSIRQITGVPGSAINIQIQGQNSILQGNDPFYVIDGVPYISQLLPNAGNASLGSSGLGSLGGNFGSDIGGNPLDFINPADIETISVLKDADATAIYGSRAANGAILITTKKGKAGSTKVDFNLQQGWGQVPHFLDLLNTQQYIQLRLQALKNDGLVTPSSTSYDINGTWDQSRYTDWQKVLIGGTAGYTNLNGSVSGGSLNTQYLFSGTYNYQGTVLPANFGDKKGAAHFNLNSFSTDRKFNFQFGVNYLNSVNLLKYGDLTKTAVLLQPDAPPLYKPDGTLNWQQNATGVSTFSNPLATLNQAYKNTTNNLISNATISYQPITGLKIGSTFGYNYLHSDEYLPAPSTFYKPELRGTAARSASYGNNTITTWNIEPQATYNHKVSDRSEVQVLLGATLTQTSGKGFNFSGTGYTSDDVLNDPNSAASISKNFSTDYNYRYNAIFGRISYNYDDKYLFNLAGRRDGSSRFGADNRFHDFFSAGLGWIFTKESFIEKALPVLSYGKIRLSYGTTGNDQIRDYSYISQYTAISTGLPYQGIVSLAPNTLGNPYLQWEETHKLQIGAELGLLKQQRILLSATYFRNRSSNQLLTYNLPSTTGFGGILENFPATVQNSGFEFTLVTKNIQKKDFSWSTNFNMTLPKNKLLAFPDLANSAYATSLFIDKPITIGKYYHFLGVDPATGLYQVADRNGNPTSNPNYNTDANVILNFAPTLYGGIGNTLTFKNFSLDFHIQFSRQLAQNYFFGSNPGFNNSNQPTSVLSAWQHPGDQTVIQRASTTSLPSFLPVATGSDASFTDASYIRLKTVAISWSAPKSFVKKFNFSALQVYASGQNLYTLTKYDGFDPESQSVTSLPPLRVFTIGLRASL